MIGTEHCWNCSDPADHWNGERFTCFDGLDVPQLLADLAVLIENDPVIQFKNSSRPGSPPGREGLYCDVHGLPDCSDLPDACR